MTFRPMRGEMLVLARDQSSVWPGPVRQKPDVCKIFVQIIPSQHWRVWRLGEAERRETETFLVWVTSDKV